MTSLIAFGLGYNSILWSCKRNSRMRGDVRDFEAYLGSSIRFITSETVSDERKAKKSSPLHEREADCGTKLPSAALSLLVLLYGKVSLGRTVAALRQEGRG